MTQRTEYVIQSRNTIWENSKWSDDPNHRAMSTLEEATQLIGYAREHALGEDLETMEYRLVKREIKETVLY